MLLPVACDQYSSSCPSAESLVHRPDKKANGCKAGSVFCEKAKRGIMCNTRTNAKKKSRLMQPPEITMIRIYIKKKKCRAVPIKIECCPVLQAPGSPARRKQATTNPNA